MCPTAFLGYIDVPRLQKTERNNVSISGCRFKFHEDLEGFGSYVIYDSNRSELTSINAPLTKTSEIDTYQFDAATLTSYLNAGTYFKCKVFNAGTMFSPAFSDFSESVPILRKSFDLFNFEPIAYSSVLRTHERIYKLFHDCCKTVYLM